MKYATAVILSTVAALSATTPAAAQSSWSAYGSYYAGQALPHVYRFNPGAPRNLYYEGLKGYHRGGWELGRMYSQRHYGTDPGPYPGFYNRRSWSRPW
jgi:hypothetical protein